MTSEMESPGTNYSNPHVRTNGRKLEFDWAERQMLVVTSDVKHPASRAYCCVLKWGGKKKALHDSRKTFEVTEARTSLPVNLVFSRQTGFTVRASVTEPAVPLYRLLGLVSKLYPSNK